MKVLILLSTLTYITPISTEQRPKSAHDQILRSKFLQIVSSHHGCIPGDLDQISWENLENFQVFFHLMK